MTGDRQLDPELEATLTPALRELAERAAVADGIVDRDTYRILVCTLWVNLVLDPPGAGLEAAQLEDVHDVINSGIGEVLGADQSLTSCFRHLNGKAGERAMQAARLTPEHRDMLLYFASAILDPEGHKRWMEEIRQREGR